MPPNAVLTVLQEPLPLDLVVVLRNTVLDGENLAYDVEVLDGPESGEGDASTLFIDAIGVRREVRQEVPGKAADPATHRPANLITGAVYSFTKSVPMVAATSRRSIS